MIYHVLPEAEPFSEHVGGALSRWAANVLREDENCTIICPWADTTWGFPRPRVWSLPGLRSYRWWKRILRTRSRSKSGGFIAPFDPDALRLRLLRSIFAPLFKIRRRGDTVYIHNRPEFALALSPACRRAGVHIVLHLHEFQPSCDPGLPSLPPGCGRPGFLQRFSKGGGFPIRGPGRYSSGHTERRRRAMFFSRFNNCLPGNCRSSRSFCGPADPGKRRSMFC